MRIAILGLLVVVFALAGCDSDRDGCDAVPERDPRKLRIVDGRTGKSLKWKQLVEQFAGAEVIVIGEKHNDRVGHAVERAAVEDALSLYPGTAVSLEMFERNEQTAVDDYLAGKIDKKGMVEKTVSAQWGGNKWDSAYQPIVDAVKSAGGRLYAANAVRKYVTVARKEGYEALAKLPADEQKLFDIPERVDDSPYKQRFMKLMGGSGSHGQAHAAKLTPPANSTLKPEATSATETKPAAPAPEKAEPKKEEPKAPPPLPPDHGKKMVESMYRSQLLWDATMAGTIVKALDDGNRRVIHIVGQFHSDFDGGTVEILKARRPGVRLLTISLQPADSKNLKEEDRGRADVIVYTGPLPPEPKVDPKPLAPKTEAKPAESAPAKP